MLTGGLDARYRQALATGAGFTARVDITDQNGSVLLGDVPYSAGQVQATLQNRVTRQLNLTVDSSLKPFTAGGLIDYTAPLAPFGNRIKAYRGIAYGDGTVWPPPYGFPVFYGCIETVAVDHTGAVQVTAMDLANEIVTAGLENPMNSIPTNSVAQEFVRLILDALPSATFGTSDPFTWGIGQLTWTDRGQALDDLGKSVSGLWYPLADGRFVQRRTPWTYPGHQPVLTLASGDTDSLGVIGQYKAMLSRTGVANTVAYVADRQDGFPALRSVARDLTTTSPTYVHGKFGKKVLQVQVQAALSQGQVDVGAQNELHKALALGVTWNPVQIVPDGSLELGDLVTITAGGVTGQQVITGFTMPLRENGAMPLQVRAYTPLS